MYSLPDSLFVFFVVPFFLLIFSSLYSGKKIPFQIICFSFTADYLRQYQCKKSNPEFEKCLLEGFQNTKPYFLKGIPEVGLPPMDPFELPVLTVNQTVNDLVSINAVCTNIKLLGYRNTVIDGIK